AHGMRGSASAVIACCTSATRRWSIARMRCSPRSALLSPVATTAERPTSAAHHVANVENAGEPGRVGELSPVSAGLSVEDSCIFDKGRRADAGGRLQRMWPWVRGERAAGGSATQQAARGSAAGGPGARGGAHVELLRAA